MVNCFLCLVNLQESNVFNILKGEGIHSKTSYGDLIGKVLQEQKLMITISDDNCICETCNTLLNAYDHHVYEQNVIKEIIARQVNSSYLKNRIIPMSIDDAALATFDKQFDNYQCKQCASFRTNKIEFATAHFKAHQFNQSKTIVKNEINEDIVDYAEMPIEEILLNPTCKYEEIEEESDAPEVDVTMNDNFDTNNYEKTETWTDREIAKKRRAYRISNDPVTNYTASTRLPRYLRNIMKITKTRSTDIPNCRPDNLFVIEVPQIETVGYHFTCKICLLKFLHPLKLASHLLTHKNIKYSCNHCLFTTHNNESSIIDHMKFNHPGVDRHDFSMDISGKLANTCFRCGYHNNTIGVACSHDIAISKGTQKFTCKMCREEFFGFDNLRNHMHVEHQLCKYCNKLVPQRFNQHKCMISPNKKDDIQQAYFNITDYNWFGSNEEFDDKKQFKSDVQIADFVLNRPTAVLMKIIPPKVKKPRPKVNKSTKLKKPNITDVSQERIIAYFNELFPVKQENSVVGSRFFCIDQFSQTTNGMVQCKICLENFSSTLKLRAHLIIHKNLTYKCRYCPVELLNNEYGMRFHMRTAHEELSKYDFLIEDSGEIINICAMCNAKVEPGEACSHFAAISNQVDIETCRNCSKTFFGDMALREHCHLEHGTCKSCQRSFPRPASLARHYVNHQNKEYFKCHTCQKVLSSVGTYKNHLSEHTGNYKYTCNVCDKKFNIKLSFEEHVRVHDMRKKYICHICGQGFIHSATFLIHKIWHKNPLPFECIVCKKKYRTRSALRMHDRKVHLKTPTTFCPECNKGLYSPADLKNHMVVHTGIYNYPCELCPSKFFRADRLRRHRKNCHGIEVPKKQIEYKVAIRPLLGEIQ